MTRAWSQAARRVPRPVQVRCPCCRTVWRRCLPKCHGRALSLRPHVQVWVLDALPGEVRSGDMGGADRPADLISTLQSVRSWRKEPCRLRAAAAGLHPCHKDGAGSVQPQLSSACICLCCAFCRSRCQCAAETGSPTSSRRPDFHGRHGTHRDGAACGGKGSPLRLPTSCALPCFAGGCVGSDQPGTTAEQQRRRPGLGI